MPLSQRKPAPSRFAPRNGPATSLSALARSDHPAGGTSPPEPPPPRSGRRLARYAALGLALAAVSVAIASNLKREQPDLLPLVLHGSPDVKRAPDGTEVRWRLAEAVVHLDPSLDRLGDGARDAVLNAFGTWLSIDAKLPAFQFEHSEARGFAAKADGKNTVGYAPITVPGHERDLAITVAFWDQRTGNIAEADIILNSHHEFKTLATMTDRESSADCKLGAYDVQAVLTHEVGHFLGLGEDMTDQASTMFFSTASCEVTKRTLESGDEAAVNALYAAGVTEPAAPEGGCGARVAPRGSLHPLALALALAFAAAQCARRRVRR